MPDVELDRIAPPTTQQLVDQEHRDQKKNGKPAAPPAEVMPLPAEAFVALDLALPIVEDDASFTSERWQSDDEGQVSA